MREYENQFIEPSSESISNCSTKKLDNETTLEKAKDFFINKFISMKHIMC